MSRSAEHHARNTFLRENLSDPEKARKEAPPTADTVKKVTSEMNLPCKVEDVPDSDGAKLHWIGDPAANKVLLYFHGGGFGTPPYEGHIKFLDQARVKLEAKGSHVLIAFLEYTLTKAKKYPTQILQATEALRLILAKGFRPEDVVIGGDSAGGNLALALASHILHPCPDVPPLKLESPLAGLLLISPWVSFESTSPSFEKNKDYDIFTKHHMHTLAKDYVFDNERNNWSEPIRAEVSWWKGLPTRKVLNVFGESEVFRDDINEFGQTLKQAGLDVKSVECPKQIHVECVADAHFGTEIGSMSHDVWDWLCEVL